MDSENHRKPRNRRHVWVIKKKGSGAERKEMGLRPAGAMGAEGRACGREMQEAPRLPGQEPDGTPGLPEVLEG